MLSYPFLAAAARAVSPDYKNMTIKNNYIGPRIALVYNLSYSMKEA